MTATATQHQAWRSGGQLMPVTTEAGVWQIFVRRVGSGPAITLIHGFPTSSWDWAELEPRLVVDHTVISFDLLGYGESSKPWPHVYSINEHADVISAIWGQLGIHSSAIVGHDVGTSVAQELLARAAEGRLETELTAVTFLNGALITDHYRPARITKMLANPLTGRFIARLMNEQRMVASLSALYSDAGRPAPDQLAEQWRVFEQHGGTAALTGLTHYIKDKKLEGDRWRRQMTSTGIPVGIVWGRADSALPQILFDDAVAALPNARAVLLDGVGHFPHVEQPQAVADMVL